MFDFTYIAPFPEDLRSDLALPGYDLIFIDSEDKLAEVIPRMRNWPWNTPGASSPQRVSYAFVYFSKHADTQAPHPEYICYMDEYLGVVGHYINPAFEHYTFEQDTLKRITEKMKYLRTLAEDS